MAASHAQEFSIKRHRNDQSKQSNESSSSASSSLPQHSAFQQPSLHKKLTHTRSIAAYLPQESFLPSMRFTLFVAALAGFTSAANVPIANIRRVVNGTGPLDIPTEPEVSTTTTSKTTTSSSSSSGGAEGGFGGGHGEGSWPAWPPWPHKTTTKTTTTAAERPVLTAHSMYCIVLDYNKE